MLEYYRANPSEVPQHDRAVCRSIITKKMAEFDEISDAEKLQIAQHYLLSSPPGTCFFRFYSFDSKHHIGGDNATAT